jgi:hypothetical protein
LKAGVRIFPFNSTSTDTTLDVILQSSHHKIKGVLDKVSIIQIARAMRAYTQLVGEDLPEIVSPFEAS